MLPGGISRGKPGWGGSVDFWNRQIRDGYTDQRPSEIRCQRIVRCNCWSIYRTVFIQGDHFQVSAKKFSADSEAEIKAVRDLSKEAVAAGFFNIDIDTSTLVDISKPTIPEQQRLNTELSAMFTHNIRSIEPAGVVISIGGEIGEVGGKNRQKKSFEVTSMDIKHN